MCFIEQTAVFSYHGHAEHERGDKENRRLTDSLLRFMERVEEICPANNP